MEACATGLILRVRPFSDTSVIVHWLTLEHGRVATLARGARRPKSPFLGRLDLFFECEFSFQRSRQSDLHALREVRLVDPHARLREDLGWEQASYAATFLEQVTETDTPLREVAGLFHGFLVHLTRQPPQARTVYAFELKLLRELGLEPGGATREGTVALALARRLADASWDDIAALQVLADQARALRQFLQGFLIHQFGRLARGRTEALHAGRSHSMTRK